MATITTTTVTTLAELKASPTSQISIVYDAALWTWTAGDYSTREEDPAIAKSDSNPLATGAWIRQGAESVAFLPRDGSTSSSLDADLLRYPVYMERYGVVGYPSFQEAIAAGDQKAAVDKARAVAVAQSRPLILPPGVVSISTFELYNGAKLLGSTESASFVLHHPGSTIPLFTIPNGVVQGGMCSGFQIFGHGAPDEIGFYIWARSPDNQSQSGMWYWDFINIVAYGFGRKAIWFRGTSDENPNAVNQFINIKGVKLFRPNQNSECLSVTRKCGQFVISEASEFDGGFSGNTILGKSNVCINREWRKVGGAPISASESGVGDYPVEGNQPYAIYMPATMQGADTAIFLDNASLIVNESDFENCNRCVHYQEGATLTFTNNELRNAAGSAGSAGQGSITRQGTPSTLVAGNNLIRDWCDQTYVCADGSLSRGFTQSSPDRTVHDLSSKPSNMMVLVVPDAYNLNAEGHSILSVQGGPSANNRRSINNITGQVKKITMVVHIDTYFRLASGGNLFVKGEVLLDPRDVCTFEWFDLYQRWQITSVVR